MGKPILIIIMHSNKMHKIRTYIKDKKNISFDVMLIGNKIYFVENKTKKMFKCGVHEIIKNDTNNYENKRLEVNVEDLKLCLNYKSVYRVLLFYEDGKIDSIPLPFNDKLREGEIKELKIKYDIKD